MKNYILAFDQGTTSSRAIVFDKCGGKCAYCGVDLVKGWNVDHIKPQIFLTGSVTDYARKPLILLNFRDNMSH